MHRFGEYIFKAIYSPVMMVHAKIRDSYDTFLHFDSVMMHTSVYIYIICFRQRRRTIISLSARRDNF